MKLYSWKDVERFCFLHRDVWESEFNSIEVYPSEIIAYKKSQTRSPINSVFQSLFTTHFDSQTQCVHLDIGNIQIPVSEEVSEEVSLKPILPLFSEILYQKSSYPQKENLTTLPCPVIAFHSFKGGVGRTLSVLSFAKAWADVFTNSNKSKLLIIDADIEAPGLTWIQSENSEEAFSYLDLLSLIQDNQNIDKIVDLACSKLGMETISVETTTRTIEHIFVPTYRYKEQLLDMYASPKTIINGKEKEYVLAEIISKICKKLGAYATLIDLRAGISEFSSTLLFDPRVKKYLITSTSTQSIKGTKIILEYLMKGLTIQADTILPEVFLSMIPETLPQDERNKIISELTQCFDQGEQSEENDFTDNVVTELPFASELIHLTSLHQILRNLNGRGMYTTIRNLIQQNFKEFQNTTERISESYRRKLLESIHNLAAMQIAAEGNNEFDLLMTSPLKYLKTKYKDIIPTTVVMGAKGSGKTFLYRKLVESQDWASFCAKLDDETIHNKNGLFLPIIASRNSKEMLPLLHACINNLNANISCAHVSDSIFFDNQIKLEQQRSLDTSWHTFWEELLSSSFNPAFHTFAEVNNALKSCDHTVVFLIDGLEEIFRQVTDSDNEREAIQILCQDIINILSAQYNNIGIISFLRRDMARDAITINFAQFELMYGRAELKWSSTEALRLAVWLVSQADKNFYTESVGLDVASQDVIDQYLTKLWGLKLGKPSSNEAYSSRWILAALSDFNGQLQARDIIRFLKYAATSNSKKAPYDDRILMPTVIKQAVSECSREKIEEVKLEYTALKPIFERLGQLPLSKKTLPLDLDAGIFNNIEEKIMVQEGYLKRDGDKYYLPEIVRHALNFKYEKGARPKVLSLILKQ